MNTIVTGFISSQSDLFKKYFAGDCLILPSYNEPWGLVVNEAMAASLPIIISDQCGASLDLVKNEYNGYIVKAGDVGDIANAIKKLIENEKLREKMGENSKNIISSWNFQNSRKSFEKMMNYLGFENRIK